MLQDDAQRTKLVDVLRTIAAATPQAAAAKPVEPTGLADQTVLALSTSAAELTKQVASAASAAARTPSLWGWLITTFQDARSRVALLDAVWKTVAIIGCGLLAEWLLGRTLARPLKALAAHAGPAAKEIHPVANHSTGPPPCCAACPRPWPISCWSC